MKDLARTTRQALTRMGHDLDHSEPVQVANQSYAIGHGDVVIAAITGYQYFQSQRDDCCGSFGTKARQKDWAPNRGSRLPWRLGLRW